MSYGGRVNHLENYKKRTDPEWLNHITSNKSAFHLHAWPKNRTKAEDKTNCSTYRVVQSKCSLWTCSRVNFVFIIYFSA